MQARNAAIGAALCLLTWQPGACQEPATDAFRASVRFLRGADLIVLEDGRTVRLQGISLPTPAVRPEGFVEGLKAFLRGRLERRTLWVYPDPEPEPGDGADLVAVLRDDPTGPSVNEEALRRGLALFSCRTRTARELDALLAAARRAQAERSGWFADRPRRAFDALPFLNGAVLGLHFEDPERDYHRHLDELAAAGFRHVCLLFSGFVEDATSTRIDRHHPRSVADHRLLETVAYAKGKGMSVMLLPIILLLDAGEDDWRGTLRPADEPAFWLAYDAFISHYLDIAEAGGVEVVSVGSELGSLEDRTATWRRLIRNARGRFAGFLTYSANWDHAHVPRFFDDLDLVGLTAYFSLTESRDPSREELAAGWRRAWSRVHAQLARLGKPVVFTELGYASQDGINRDPWNYVMNEDRLDLQEQADCLAAFIDESPRMDGLGGAYLFQYFGEGGRGDPGYSPRGKPAMGQWRRWAALDMAELRRRGGR